MDIYQKTFFICGALLGFFAVLAGAFGSHLLKQKISSESLQIFEVAVRYQMYHALALIALAGVFRFSPSNWLNASGWLFIIGTCIFSGSLYLLVFTREKQWGAVTPVGGVLLLAGWLFSIAAALLS
jgi:uncharacterized membrane protein YgdD (TMEM256/DUF423 family)